MLTRGPVNAVAAPYPLTDPLELEPRPAEQIDPRPPEEPVLRLLLVAEVGAVPAPLRRRLRELKVEARSIDMSARRTLLWPRPTNPLAVAAVVLGRPGPSTRRPPRRPARRSSPSPCSACACTAAAFGFYGALVAEAGPGRALVITYVTPVVAVALGVALLGGRRGCRRGRRAAPDPGRIVAVPTAGCRPGWPRSASDAGATGRAARPKV